MVRSGLSYARDMTYDLTRKKKAVSPIITHLQHLKSSKMAPAGTLWTTPYQVAGKSVQDVSFIALKSSN
jgi:hypothetical protein